MVSTIIERATSALPSDNNKDRILYAGAIEIDAAIVGAGIAGLAAADDIAEAGFRVAVYEADDEIGGRIPYRQVPRLGWPLAPGPMRGSDHQRELNRLVKKLGLRKAQFDFSESTSFLLRGLRMSARGMKSGICSHCGTALSFPYALTIDEQAVGNSPDGLVQLAIKRTLKDLTFPALTREQAASVVTRIEKLNLSIGNWKILSDDYWQLIQEYGQLSGKPLYMFGFWNILQRYLSSEGYQLVHDAFGYESISSNWNAAEAAWWFAKDFDPTQKWFTLRDGFQELPRRLEERIRKRGIKLALKHRLTRLTPLNGGSKWRLEFETESGEMTAVIARRVILALPRGPLEKLYVDHPGWRKFKAECLSAVQPHPLFKVSLIYESPWWSKYDVPGGESGRVFTDLPLRQVYYFGWQRARSKRDWVTVMGYSDDRFVEYWSAFEEGPPHFRQPVDWNSMSRQEQDDLLHINGRYGTSTRMIDDIRQQLAQIHGVPPYEIPEPVIGVYMDWERKAGAGWHTWQVGFKAWEIARRVRKPFSDTELYICGESYSRDQGWIEGSLKSAREVAREVIDSLHSRSL
ncbi:MAG: FAD-dependent oxidoreductase [Chloroflexota bacterium]|nr:FAD-dependent oxidoreductase [Chloroflexota bacterium]